MKKIIYFSFILLIQTTFIFGQALTPNTTGSFVFTPTGPLSSKPITVYYHIPNGNISTMPILFSLHGDERNASDYRDYWISMANANGFMVFAPEYSETHYPAGDGYQLGNVFDDGDNPSLSTLNPTNEWTFSTVDPLFESIKTRVSGTQQAYDAWGHSGGAQFLQRFRMYLPNSKMNTAICSNAGWYTVPESAVDFPYGINNGQLSNGNLTIALSKKIIVHLGLNDTDPNSLGLRHNNIVDNQQGLFRLARGRYFFNTSLSFSQTLSNNFNWQREEVTGVGHDPQHMANDALRFLFQTNANNITYSILDGGYENQSGTLAGGTSGVLVLNGSTWTANTTGNVVRASLASGGRTGPKYVSLGSSNGTAKSFYSPQIAGAFAPNTTYQIQFWYKSVSTVALDASTVDLYVDNNSASTAGTKQSIAAGLSTNIASWTKVTVPITTNATATGNFGVVGFTIDATTSGYSADFDDFVIYQANSADTTAPNSPGAITATGATSGGANVSWVSASGGVDGGGYVVVRYAITAPSASDDLVQNGIYKFANTVGAGVVRYIGSGTSFTDSGLSPGVDYYYKVYTVDKAFNYSDESTTSSPVQSLATTYYYKGTGLLTDVSSWGQNTNGTGTTPTNFTDPSQVFEIRNTTAVTLDGTWTVGADPANGTKVRLGNTDQAAITLTLNSGASIGPSGTGNFDVMTPSSGNQTVIYKTTSALSFGSILDTNFEVIYDGVTVSSSSTKSFGTVSIINGANITFTSSISINNLFISNGANATFSSTPSITNSLINGTLIAPTNSSSFIVIPSGGSLTVNGTIKIPRLSGFVSSLLGTANTTTSGTNIQFLGSENLTLGANSTVEYIRTATGAQTVTARTDYKNLILSGTTPKTVNGPTTVSGTLTVNQSTAVTLTGDITVNGSLSFVLGKITTGNNTVTIGTSGTITGANQSTGWVVGNLKKQTSSGTSPSFSYAIGDSNNYTPLALTFTGTTSATGGLTAKINIGDHPQIAGSSLDSTKSVNKTWTLINDSLTGFGTYNAAFTYSSADIDGISTPANFVVGLYDGSTWLYRTISGTPSDTATTATGITSFGDFAIGECGGATTIGSETRNECGASYTWPTSGVTYSSSGTYTHVVGCNTATLTLTLTPAITNTTTVSSFLTYTWANNNQTYTTSGIYEGTTTDCVTELLNLTITNTEIPTGPLSLCKGATVSTIVGNTSLKFYTALTGGTVLTGTTALTTKTYYVTETIASVESSPRVALSVIVLALPTQVIGTITSNTESTVTAGTYLAATTAVGQFVGTSNTVSYRVPAFADTTLTYYWTVPAGVNIVSQDANVLTVNFLNVTAGAGTIGNITVQAQNANGCRTAAKTLALTKVLPVAPSAIKMTDASLPIPTSGIPAAVTSFGQYMGTNKVLTLTATASTTATSYVWELPTGVTQLSGGNSNIITVDFSGVTSSNTTNYLSSTGVSTNSLRIGVKASNGVGVSVTSNTALTNPTTTSTAKLLTLTATTPTAPTFKLTNDLVSTTTAVTVLSKFIGTNTEFTLTSAVAAGASSYEWLLPSGVNVTSGNPATDRIIKVNFAGVGSGITTIYIGARSKNGIGTSNSSSLNATAPNPYTNSPYKLLKLTATVPAAVTTVSGQIGGVCGGSNYSYTITPSLLANSYSITAPTGSVVTSTSNSSNNSNTLVTSDLTFSVTYPIGFVGHTTASPKTVAVASVNGVGASTTSKILNITTAMPAIGTATGSSGITSFSRCNTQSFVVPAVLGATNYVWAVTNGAVIVNGQGTNAIEVDFSAVLNSVTSTKITVLATNTCGVSTALKTITLASAACKFKADTDLVDNTISIYPNPARDNFTIQLNAAEVSEISMTIYNINGTMIRTKNIPLTEGNIMINEDISSLASGIYFVQIYSSSNQETIVKKLVKE